MRASGESSLASHASAAAWRASPANISGRLPIRSDSSPASGATKIGIAVHGSVRTPASIGDCSPGRSGRTARAGRSRRTSRSTSPARRRWSPRTRGCGRTASAASGRRRAAPRRRTCDQQRDAAGADGEHGRARPAEGVGAHERVHDPEQPAAGERDAAEVEVPCWGRGSRSGAPARAAATIRPIGTLIQKIQCHEMPLTTAPPITGPSATPRPLTPDQIPSAMPRLPGRERLREQRQRQRQHQRAAHSLDRAGGDQRAGAGRERGRRRGAGENRQARSRACAGDRTDRREPRRSCSSTAKLSV